LIISLVISSFLVLGVFFLVQKIRENNDLHSLLKNQAPVPLYTVHGSILLYDDSSGRNARTIDLLQKRLSAASAHGSLKKKNDGVYTLSADGVKDSALLKTLLSGSSSLQWWELYNIQEFLPFLLRADSLLSLSIKKKEVVRGDTAKAETVEQLLKKKTDKTEELNTDKEKHPFFSLLHMSSFVTGNPNYGIPGQVGFVPITDTPVLNRYLQDPVVKACMPPDAVFLYGKPFDPAERGQSMLYFYALKKSGPRPILDESFITDARLESGRRTTGKQVMLNFNTTGASRLQRLTTANVGRYIAMVGDNEVLTAARVESPIYDGSLAYSTGIAHDADLVYLLAKYGPIPTHVTVSRLVFSPQRPPSLFKPAWLLGWLAAFALVFGLVSLLFGNMLGGRRQ